MTEADRIPKETLFARLPAPWPEELRAEIRRRHAELGAKLAVLDDDPTGTQTVHGIPVVTRWSAGILCDELRGPAPAFYILTNSRALSEADARALNHEIGRELSAAEGETRTPVVIVSRSDSTLRGHFPGEVEALAEGLGRDFRAWLIVPFFESGGRYTVGDVHYVEEGGELIPAAQTSFAADPVFGYTHSNLRHWIEEKTGGRVKAAAVHSITIEDIRLGGPDTVLQRLSSIPRGGIGVVNAAAQKDLEVLAVALLRAEQGGERFLYRTAASFVPARAGIEPRPLLTPGELRGQAGADTVTGGLTVVGSHVPRSRQQLACLTEHADVDVLEARVERLLDRAAAEEEVPLVAERASRLLEQGRDTVIATSERLVTGPAREASLTVGKTVSAALVRIVEGLRTAPRYLVAKGGITSSDIATEACGVRRAMVLGQILPGVPVWQLGPETRWPGLPYVVFPGNVGPPEALRDLVTMLRA